jgi:hypothetical protein
MPRSVASLAVRVRVLGLGGGSPQYVKRFRSPDAPLVPSWPHQSVGGRGHSANRHASRPYIGLTSTNGRQVARTTFGRSTPSAPTGRSALAWRSCPRRSAAHRSTRCFAPTSCGSRARTPDPDAHRPGRGARGNLARAGPERRGHPQGRPRRDPHPAHPHRPTPRPSTRLEAEWTQEAIQRITAENTTLKQRVRQLTADNQSFDERLKAARSNLRFQDRRVTDLEAQIAAPAG